MALFGSIVLMLLGICVCIVAGIVTLFANGISTRDFDWQEILFIIAIFGVGFFLVYIGAYYSPIHITVI